MIIEVALRVESYAFFTKSNLVVHSPSSRIFPAISWRKLSCFSQGSRSISVSPVTKSCVKTHSISQTQFALETVHSEPLSLENADGIWSVVIPTYNRLPILLKCLEALENQSGYAEVGILDYEVIVVDDGSTDGTVEYIAKYQSKFSHVRFFLQQHGGAAAARNFGVSKALGETIVFIDSDMVVVPEFLQEHCLALKKAYHEDDDDRAFSYGRVVNTANFDNPQSERFKFTDMSAAFFATGNVAISRNRLIIAGRLLAEKDSIGPFDSNFSEYGWEDLELGERLRQQGARLIQCPRAIGFHYHPPFSFNQIPRLVEQERQRGRMGVRFLRKHPNLNVRLMVQLTPFHEVLWTILTLGGVLNEVTLGPLLMFLMSQGRWRLALAFLSPVLNWHTVQAAKEKLRRERS